MVVSRPNSLAKYLPNSVSNDGKYSPDSTSTIKASDNDFIVEAPPTAGVQFLADNSNEEQHKPPHAHSFPTDGSPVLSHSNHLKHRVEFTNSVSSSQHRKEYFALKPTAIIRPWINFRLRYGSKPEIDSWEFIFKDNQRKELTIQNTSLPSQRLVVPLQAVTVLPQ